jgi:hypothetical protein
VRLFTPELRRVLFIGGGVGVGPRSFRRHYPQAEIDLVEIDPAVVALAGRHFHFAPDRQMRVHVEDGRAFLRRRPAATWDAILLDAFGSGGRLPFHLMTREFLETLKGHLTAGGVVLANLPSALAGEARGVVRAEYRTFQAVFPAVTVFPRHDPAEGDAGSPSWWGRARNVFRAATLGEPRTKAALVAEAQRLWGDLARPPHTRVNTELFSLACHSGSLLEPGTLEEQGDLAGTPLLTDDFAPVDTRAVEVSPAESGVP